MKSFDERQYPHSELSGGIIAAATLVHTDLRPGLDEVLYERARCIEFGEQSIPFDQQKVFGVHYKTHSIGNLIPDLIIDGKIIVDLKVVEAFTDAHIAQMLGYLNITGLDLGLLINFKHARLQIKRIISQKQRPPHS